MNQNYRSSKYKSRKITKNGITYDSIKEYRRHMELLMLERAGAIQNLQRQVKFDLIPKQKEPDTGKAVRKTQYIADFVYTQDGKSIVEDVKGYRHGGAYALFMVKKKLMLEKHGIWVQEV